MKCIICGKKITSEKSLILGSGGGCRNKNSKHSAKWRSKVTRTAQYDTEKPVKVGKSVWSRFIIIDNDGEIDKVVWQSSNKFDDEGNIREHDIEDGRFKNFLIRNDLILDLEWRDKDGNGVIDMELWNRVKGDIDGFFNGDNDEKSSKNNVDDLGEV